MNVLPIAFALLSLALLLGSLDLNPVAGTTPAIIAGLTLALLAMNAVRQHLAGGAVVTDRRRANGLALAWLSGLCLAVWLTGLAVGLALLCLAMLRIQFRESWRISIAAAMVIGPGLWGTFYLLGIPLYGGLAGTWWP